MHSILVTHVVGFQDTLAGRDPHFDKSWTSGNLNACCVQTLDLMLGFQNFTKSV